MSTSDENYTRWRLVAIIVFVLLGIEAVILTSKWPFRRAAVTLGLERVTKSNVRIGRFRLTFFPNPGCVAEEVAVVRGAHRLAYVRKLGLQGSWASLLAFQRRLNHASLEGLEVRVPEPVPPPVEVEPDKKGPPVIGELVADGTFLEVARQAADPLRFEFPRLTLTELSRKTAIGFSTVVRNPEPPGSITAKGSFGPWNSNEHGSTPLSGSFQLTEGDLSRYHGIAGKLAARGSFEGNLARVAVRGTTDVPDFEVNRNGHRVHVRTKYQAVVNAQNGDTVLEDVEAQFLGTRLSVKGTVADEEGRPGKFARLDFEGHDARIQDLLRLFTGAKPPAVNGPIVLRAHAVLPPGDEPFLRRIELDGTFGIDNARFNKAATQRKVDELSSRARGVPIDKEDGEQAERVVSDLKGRAVLRDGVARLSDVSFAVPGAVATGGGTYNVISKRVDLRGTVAMDATVSEASKGIKSVLLKPFNVFFKKQNSGVVLPVSVTGVYPHPVFQVSLTAKR